MIKINTEDVYTAERVRGGSSNRGMWELIVVKNGREEITLWASNPGSGLTDGDRFKIKSIDSFTKKRVAYTRDGRVCKDRSNKDVEWRTDVDANVTVEKFGSTDGGIFDDDPPFMFDDDNPFAGDLPL